MKFQNRRDFLAASLAGGLGWTLSCASKKPARPPNIVFLMADDLGYGDLGCYGQTRIRTPNIDRLAAEGMKFTDAYAGCTVCAPSRSVLMTGLHMGHTSVRSNPGGVPLLAEDVTVAEILKQAGYATGCFGKWGLGDIGTDGVPWKQGFDEFFGYLHQVHAHFYYPEFLYKNDQEYPLPGNENKHRSTYSHDVIAEQAREFIRNHKDQPFFCYVPFTIPHLRMMALVAELGIDENTLVIFTSDNGAATPLWDPEDYFNSAGGFRGHKQNFYEGGIRVPLVARWPGRIAAGSVSHLPCAFCDFLPTACELSGQGIPPYTDGISILPALLGKGKQKEHEFLYWELPRYNNTTHQFREEIPRQAVRMGNWKAVRPVPDGPLELYNLEADPKETTNVAAGNPAVMLRAKRGCLTPRRKGTKMLNHKDSPLC